MKLSEKELSKDLTQVWNELGNHSGRIANLENERYAVRQDFISHRAETLSIFREIRQEFNDLVKPLVSDIGHIKKFMYLSIGGFTAMSGLFTILINFDKVKGFFGG